MHNLLGVNHIELVLYALPECVCVHVSAAFPLYVACLTRSPSLPHDNAIKVLTENCFSSRLQLQL